MNTEQDTIVKGSQCRVPRCDLLYFLIFVLLCLVALDGRFLNVYPSVLFRISVIGCYDIGYYDLSFSLQSSVLSNFTLT